MPHGVIQKFLAGEGVILEGGFIHEKVFKKRLDLKKNFHFAFAS